MNHLTSTNTNFSTQRDAVNAARLHIWGTDKVRETGFVSPKTHPDFGHYDHRGVPTMVVSAQVNGRLVLIDFDHYGRATVKVVS